MVEATELLGLITGCVVAGYFAINRVAVLQLPHGRLLMASFTLLFASIVCSVAEVLVWETYLDLLQHTLAPASVLLLAIWSWLTFVRPEEQTT